MGIGLVYYRRMWWLGLLFELILGLLFLYLRGLNVVFDM